MSEWVRTGVGLIVPEHAIRVTRRPTAVDLFCGCGGFSLGLLQAGFEILAGLDNEPISMMTYLNNLGSYPVDIRFATPEDKDRANKQVEAEIRRENEGRKKGLPITMPVSGANWNSAYPPIKHFFLGDIRKFSGKDILEAVGKKRGDVDLVVGGPPCQGFSYAGRRNVMDPRNSLVFEFARLVLEIHPKMMMMENVPGILNMTTPEGLPVVDVFCRILEDGGFGTWETLKDSLLLSSGAGAAVRGRMPKDRRKPKAEDDEDQEQLTLFKEEAAI